MKTKTMLPAPDPVFTLSDLESWDRPGVSLAVLGHPIKHSISPAIHNAALADLARTDGRFSNWKYFRFEIRPEDLPRALQLLHAKKFRGINLTVPHKVIAFDQVTAIDEAVRRVGAVNTLLWTPAGWHGFNTDGYGLATAMREALGCDLAGRSIVLLGAGGAARGAAVECLQRGCAALWVANRTAENLTAFLASITPVARNIPLRGFSPSAAPSDLPARALLINATSSGLQPTDEPPIDLKLFRDVAGVYDMIYNPPQTRLLRSAAEAGIPHANGLGMLIHQGAKSLEIWSGIAASQTAAVMLSAAWNALSAG